MFNDWLYILIDFIYIQMEIKEKLKQQQNETCLFNYFLFIIQCNFREKKKKILDRK